jgi:putative ATP-dependent endonuclease of OLD family
MKLKSIILKNFRAYREQTVIPLDDLTAFIGKNDVGKSSILQAVGLFLGSDALKLDAGDRCVHSSETEVRIGCVFTQLPAELVIDVAARTTLADEHLLNADGDLELHQIFECRSGKVSEKGIVALAVHPRAQNAADLLLLTNAQLKLRAKDVGVDLQQVDQRSNVELRQAIRRTIGSLDPGPSEIPLNKEGGKEIWEQLMKELPVFALFRADRPCTDEDAEAQDPMQVAVRQAIAELSGELETVKTRVKERVLDVATRTVAKLKELDPKTGANLSPRFRAEPKWDAVFKLNLDSDDGIPLNKRGSGFRRLVLLSFFRAEAERQQTARGARGIIYAIEEPEASQHPENQALILDALTRLAANSGCQVLLTTHVPGLAGLLPTTSIRHVTRQADGTTSVSSGTDGMLKDVASDLGVLPDSRVRVLVCLEGPNDVKHLNHLARILRAADPTLPDLKHDPRLTLITLGGENLRQWVTQHYLRRTGLCELHIYDRGTSTPPKFQAACEEVNARTDRSAAFLTQKRELENYLHADAVEEALGVRVVIDDSANVGEAVAEAVHAAAPDAATPWSALDDEKQRKKTGHAKRRLNDEAAARMTLDRLIARSARDEVTEWLRAIAARLPAIEEPRTTHGGTHADQAHA